MSKKRVKYLFFPFVVLIISSILVFLIIPGKKVQRPVHVDPETLKAYVGHYRVLPDFTISITSRYGFLYYQPTTQSYGDKLLAKSETEFYLEEWGNTSIEFRKDTSEEKYDLFIIKPKKAPLGSCFSKKTAGKN